MNDTISSRQHEPNQVAQFSQQPSPQYGYQQTVYSNLSVAIAPPNVTHRQEAEPPDFSNQQKTSDIEEISFSSPANSIRRRTWNSG